MATPAVAVDHPVFEGFDDFQDRTEAARAEHEAEKALHEPKQEPAPMEVDADAQLSTARPYSPSVMEEEEEEDLDQLIGPPPADLQGRNVCFLKEP